MFTRKVFGRQSYTSVLSAKYFIIGATKKKNKGRRVKVFPNNPRNIISIVMVLVSPLILDVFVDRHFN